MTLRLKIPGIWLALLVGAIPIMPLGAQEGAGRVAVPAVPAGTGSPSEFATLPPSPGPGAGAPATVPVAVPLDPASPVPATPD
ncbi:MAG: hypothetical protein ABL994_17705, partial [Verrucomicrobiales bacterium]